MNESQIKILEKIVRLRDLQLYTMQIIQGKNGATVPRIYLRCKHNWFEIGPEVEAFDGSYIEWTVMELHEIDPSELSKYIAGLDHDEESRIDGLISIKLPGCNLVKSAEVYKFSVSNPHNPNEAAEYEGCILFHCDSELCFAISSYQSVTGTLSFFTDKKEIDRIISMAIQRTMIV